MDKFFLRIKNYFDIRGLPKRYLVSSESYWAQGIKARSKKEAIETFLYVYGEEPTKVERID